MGIAIRATALAVITFALLCPTAAVAQDTLTAEMPDTATTHRPTEEYNRRLSVSGEVGGHDYVDLGLSVRWATRNVGADNAAACGRYYAWGETSTKKACTPENSVAYGKKLSDIGGNTSRDPARTNWGAPWRLPTREEMEELITRCHCVWTRQGGHSGYLVTGPNGNTIFLPAAGRQYGTDIALGEDVGLYLSSTPREEGDGKSSYGLGMNGGDIFVSWYPRYFGMSARPVCK